MYILWCSLHALQRQSGETLASYSQPVSCFGSSLTLHYVSGSVFLLKGDHRTERSLVAHRKLQYQANYPLRKATLSLLQTSDYKQIPRALSSL